MDPSNPVNPSIPSSSFVPAPGSPPVVTPPLDNTSAYSADIAAGRTMTIVGFSKAIISSTNELNETTWQVQQFNATSRGDMYVASITEFLSLLNLYAQIYKATSEYSNAYKQNNSGINTVNNKIHNYNNGNSNDASEVNTVNNAINDYNNGNITQAQLQTALNHYNSYVSSRNALSTTANNAITTYNNNLLAKNSELQALYNELINSGVSPTTLASLNLPGIYTGVATNLNAAPTTAPSSPPVSTVSYSGTTTLTDVTNTMNNKAANDGVELATEIFAPSFELLQGQLMITIQMLENQSDFQGFIQFYFNNVPFVPASFYQPKPAPQAGSGASGSEGAGSGGSLTTIITSLSSSLMEAALSKSKFTAAYGETIRAPTVQVINELSYLGLSLLSQIGLQSGSPSLRLLQGRVPFIDPRSSPVLALVGGKLTNEAGAAISSGAVLAGVKEILAKAYPGLDETSLNALAEKLAAAVELFIIQASITQLAQVLNTPDLLDQIFATLPESKSVSSQPTSADIVQDDVVRSEISRNVINATTINRDIINQAINSAVVAGDYNQGAFINSLVASGIDQKEAANAADIMQSYIKSEINGSGILDQAVSSNRLNSSILANQYVSQLLQQQPDITNRELRDRLVTDFVANGATQQEAIATATLAVTGKPETSVPVALADILYKKGIEQIAGLGLSPSEAQAFANELVNTVIGPNTPGSQTSIRELIDSRLKILVKGADEKTTEKVYETFQNFLAPSRELSVFAERLRENPLIFIGIMYDHPKPLNFTPGISTNV